MYKLHAPGGRRKIKTLFSVLVFCLFLLTFIIIPFATARAPSPQHRLPQGRFTPRGNFAPQQRNPAFRNIPTQPQQNWFLPQQAIPAQFAPEGGGVHDEELFPDVPRLDVYRLRCTSQLNPYCSDQFTLSDLRVGIGMAELQSTIDNCVALGVQPFKSRTYIETAFDKQNRANPMLGFAVATGTEGLFTYCNAQLRITSEPTVDYSAGTRTATITWETSINSNSSVHYSAATLTDRSMAKTHSIMLAGLIEGRTYEFQIQSCTALPTTQCVSSPGSFTTAPPETAHLLHMIDEVGIVSFTTFSVAGGSEKLIATTFRESTPGQGGVWASEDGSTWEELFTANITGTMTGVYSAAVVSEAGTDVLYVGTGGHSDGDGQVWKTTDGRSWVRADTFARGERKVNQLKTIDGIVYAASTTSSNRGSLCSFNPAMSCAGEIFEAGATSVEKFRDKLYVLTALARAYEQQLDGSFIEVTPELGLGSSQANQLQAYSGRLYLAGGGLPGDAILFSTADARTWGGEMFSRTDSVKNLRVLSDGKLYISTSTVDNGRIYKKNSGGSNSGSLMLGSSSYAAGVIEFGESKYAFGNTATASEVTIGGRPQWVPDASASQVYLVTR